MYLMMEEKVQYLPLHPSKDYTVTLQALWTVSTTAES